mgnify:CR=1 FL=1
MQLSSEETSLSQSPDQTAKIQALRDMISNAERTIQSAKAMLLQIEGKKKSGRPKKIDAENEGTVVEGTFDGQIMMGTDGRQYPVPANYASKSKLVEGDLLKLTITLDGSFVYKQISPIDRRHAIGIVSQDEGGNYHILIDGEPFRVLLASVTYFRVSPGDEVAVVMPRDLDASWVAIENVLRKGSVGSATPASPLPIANTKRSTPGANVLHDLSAEEKTVPLPQAHEETIATPSSGSSSALDEWMRDMETLEKELSAKSS